MSAPTTHHVIVHSVITATVAMLPSGVVNYAEKLLSVLVLAMLAEVGRQVVIRMWGKK